MRYAYIFIIVIHGLIHLVGWFKAMGWAENSPLTAPISRSMGGFWALTALLLVSYAVIYGLRMPASWMLGLAAMCLSQGLIIMYWTDARYGTILNMLMLIAILFSYGEWQFKRQARQAENALLAGQPQPRQTLSDTSQLPPPVKKWVVRSGALDKAGMAYGEIRQRLQLKTAVDQETFFPATAQQLTRIDTPGFLWEVEVSMNPVMWMRGRDSYQAGKGTMNIWLNSLIPVVQEAGPKIDEGAMQRFLGEMVWFPQQALQPYIKWESIDAESARATMSWGGISASGVFSFAKNGDFIRFDAMRYYGADPDGDRIPWILTVQNYEVFEGVRVPSHLEASWELDSGHWTWLKMEVDSIRYEVR
jgi:hypothetical protein